jgi:uncharacterized protein YecA (UPF0149 family)
MYNSALFAMVACLARHASQGPKNTPVVRKRKPKFTDVGRNDDCPCGSGQKFKRCCIRKAA